MPRLNILGDAAMGNGSGFTSVNGAVLPSVATSVTGDPRWYADDTLVFQVSQLGSTLQPGLSFYDLGTDVVTVIQSAGANRLGAGGGVWADFLAVGDGQVTTSHPLTFPGAGLGDVGEDGSLATLTNYLTGGVTAYNATGAFLWSDGVKLRFDIPIPVRSGLVAYCAADTGWTIRAMDVEGRVVPYWARVDLPIACIPVLLDAGDLYVVEQATVDGGNLLTIRKATEAKGYVIASGVPTFQPDAREVSPGIVRICWSSDIGESADALELMDLALVNGGNSTGVITASAIVWTPQTALTKAAIATVPGTGLTEGRAYVTNPIPTMHPLLTEGGRVSRPWQDYFESISRGNSQSVTFRGAVPKAVQLPAWRSISSGENTPLYAKPDGNFDINSATIEITLDPVTQQVQLEARNSGGGGGIPGETGDDGQDGMPGQTGPMGPQGPAGPTGSSGAGILGPMGLTGDDGEMFMMPGPQGPQGAQGVPGSGGGTSSTAYGSEPGSPSTGDLDLYSNSFYVGRYSGSAWVPWGPIYAMTQPVDGDFAWINQGGASVDASKGGIYLLGPASTTTSLRLRVKAKSAPYTITAAFLMTCPTIDFVECGLAFRQSSDGKLAVLMLSSDASQSTGWFMASRKWASPTSFSGNYVTATMQPPAIGAVVWFQLSDDSTNRIVRFSSDGQNWTVFHSVGRTDFLTADQVGFYVNAQNATYGVGMTLLSWKET